MQIHTHLKPNSKHREGVILGEDGTYTIHAKAPAVENKANLAAIQLLAKHFGVSKSNVRLVRGHTSKHKVFEIKGEYTE